MSMILTDDEIATAIAHLYAGPEVLAMALPDELHSARAVEAAVLAKLAQQKPVAWHTEDHLADRSATTYSKEVMRRWQGKGWPVTPLYAHPAPQQAVPDGYKLVPVEALKRWRAAFAEELAAYDIDPPIHHLEASHDEIDAMLAAEQPAPVPLTDEQIGYMFNEHIRNGGPIQRFARAIERAHGITKEQP